jgi:cell division protein FtsB
MFTQAARFCETRQSAISSASASEPQAQKTRICSSTFALSRHAWGMLVWWRSGMKVSLVKIGYAAVLLGGLSYGCVQLRGPNGVSALMDRRQEIKNLEKENEQLQRELAAKRTHLERLKSNPDEQELEIRKDLKLLKPGEKSYIMQDTPAPGK